ncbi:MAG: protein-L-isoaspartate(D-aspartate) O-methyltransferase [Lentisphaerae bacterium]|nr:protein-L-isoaspartate(D-aspartate) O-methyltransferase [Lentisphaerota bacterium]
MMLGYAGSWRGWVGRLVLVALGLVGGAGVMGCSRGTAEEEGDTWAGRREQMVVELRHYGITNQVVLDAMGRIPRHLFIPLAYRNRWTAYADRPWPIGHDQTISQPFIVAYMTEKLALQPGEKVLEIGTGSGYQAAVLAECGAEVYSIEIIPELASHATAALEATGYGERVKVLAGDGYKGWPEHQPFDCIIVTCAPEEVPAALVEQLREGGRMILPLGAAGRQRLVILRKEGGEVSIQDDLPVRFVPMVHEAER